MKKWERTLLNRYAKEIGAYQPKPASIAKQRELQRVADRNRVIRQTLAKVR